MNKDTKHPATPASAKPKATELSVEDLEQVAGGAAKAQDIKIDKQKFLVQNTSHIPTVIWRAGDYCQKHDELYRSFE